MAIYEYRVFISHVWRIHTPYYDGLIRLLERARRFGFREMGVPRRRQIDGAAPMEKILEILRSSDVVIVINTPVLGKSENVLAELEEAVKCGIPIIAVTPKGKRGAQHPIIDHARKAAWIGNSIVAAIREEVALSRRFRAKTSTIEVGPAIEDAFEPVEVAAPEARANLTPEQLDEVRGEDEIMEAQSQSAQSVFPKDVISGDKQHDHVPQPPAPTPSRSWFRRIFNS